MASIIRIKRSETSGNPSTLAQGELAYSALADNGSNGGDRLYIGMGTETAGNAVNHVIIGGKYFTDKLDHTPGTLTASSAIITDANNKIDQLLVDDLSLNGATLSTTTTNGDLYITPNGTGKTVITNLYIGDTATSLAEYIADQTGGSLVAGLGIDTSYNAATNETTISAELASSTNAGVASFDATDFSVTGTGENLVTINAERIQDLVGGMLSGTGATQNGITVGYDDTNGKLTFDVADPTITIAGDVDGSATMTNLGNTTIAVTLDTVNSNIGTFGSNTAVPVVTVDAKGRVTAVSTQSISTWFNIAGDSGSNDTVAGGETLTFTGTDPIDTAISNNTVTISAKDATTTTKGVASFSSASFDVTSGAVTIKTGGVSNTQLANSSITIGSTSTSLGGTSTALAGLTQLTVDNIDINGNEISTTNTNGDLSLNPNGTGVVNVNSSRITNVADPTQDTDAANKAYVDARAAGLDPKQSVRATTTASITLSNTQTIDGVALSVGDRVLVKDQATASQNGIYIVASGAWTRATDFDQPAEATAGTFVFVEEGTLYADSGWVMSASSPATIGTDPITFVQFSGAGQIVAGAGLTKTGNTLDVNVAANGGIEISADALQLKSTVAGDGLTLTSGVLSIGSTTNRITVTADAVDIASTYVGQTSITTLGTITTGTWNGTTIGTGYGGTGLTSYTTGDLLYASATNTLSKLAAGADGKVLQINSSGVPVWGDIDGGTY